MYLFVCPHLVAELRWLESPRSGVRADTTSVLDLVEVHVLDETITMVITRCPMVDVTITMAITR